MKAKIVKARIVFLQGTVRAELLHHLSIALAITDSEIKLRQIM